MIMTRINLLPWREMRRRKRQRNFIITIGAAILVGALGVFGTHAYIERIIEHQVERNNYLRAEIAKLRRAAEEIKKINEAKTRLLNRLEIIQNLQSSRPIMVKVLDGLVQLVPEDIYLSSLTTEGAQLVLDGTAVSNNIISDFMRNLDTSQLFGEPVLKIVESRDFNNIRISSFQLAVRRTTPKKDTYEDDTPP